MIRETLKNLPEGLGDTYRRILIKISKSSSRARLAQKVFNWATVAKRPLHVEELKEAVAFGPDDRSWSLDKIPHEDLMFESCRGLIIKDEDDETAHFAHHTVRQYLTGGLTTKVDPQFEILIENAEVLAGETCVAYLSFSDFETQVTSTTSTVRFKDKGVLESGGPLWIPSILGIRKPMFDVPYRLLRGDPTLRPSGSDYWKHLVPNPKPKISPSTHLVDKYQLLSYAIENWEPHTRFYDSAKSHVNPYHHHLVRLAMHKTLAFEFRPWGPNQHFGPYGCVGCPSPGAGGLVAKDLPHMSMIHYAAKVGNIALLVSGLTSESRYIHHERYHQETLMIACRQNRIKIVKYLIKHWECDVSDGRVVNAAAAAGHAEVLQYLLMLGQYSVKQQGAVALFLAAKHGHDAIITVLAEARVNLNAKDQRTGRNAIETAAMYGQESTIRVLFEKGSISDHVLGVDRKALHLAAAGGHPAVTRALLERGFPTNVPDLGGKTALHHAAESGHENVAEILLEYGANPSVGVIQSEASDYHSGETSFHLAASGGHVKVLELFGKQSPPEDYPFNSTSKTALHSAAAGGHVEAIRWLVSYGLDVNAKDDRHRTPLFYAILLGEETAVKILLELGASALRPASLYRDSDVLIRAVERETTSILRMLLASIKEDRKTLYNQKRESIVSALNIAREMKETVAEELLERELRLYPEGKSADNV